MPQNTGPLVEAGGDATVAEGSLFARAGSFTDPDADSWSATVDYGDGAGAVPLSLAADKSFQLSHTYLDNGSYAVTVSVDDGHTSGSDSFQVAVSNVAPSVQAGPDATVAAGATLSRPGSFSDPGSLDSWTATVDYGDGSGSQPLLLPGLDHSFQLLHTYTSAGQFTLTVTVSDDDGGAGSDTVTVTVEAPLSSADLSIAQSDAPDPALVGGTLVYTLTESNVGPTAADGVTVTDALPAGVVFVSATSTRGSCSQSSGVVTCTFASLPSGATASQTITVTPTQPGTITNSASVAASAPSDPDTSNNAATTSTTVNAVADLALTKTETPNPVQAGRSLGYALTVTNNGPSTATGVTVTDPLPATVSFAAASASQGSCSGTTTITCNLGALASGAQATVTITVTADQAGTVTNTASVSSETTDPSSSNNSATATTTVDPAADLALTKTGAPNPVVGSSLTYTLTVTNNGPSAAAGVTVSDTLPPNVTFDSAVSSAEQLQPGLRNRDLRHRRACRGRAGDGDDRGHADQDRHDREHGAGLESNCRSRREQQRRLGEHHRERGRRRSGCRPRGHADRSARSGTRGRRPHLHGLRQEQRAERGAGHGLPRLAPGRSRARLGRRRPGELRRTIQACALRSRHDPAGPDCDRDHSRRAEPRRCDHQQRIRTLLQARLTRRRQHGIDHDHGHELARALVEIRVGHRLTLTYRHGGC